MELHKLIRNLNYPLEYEYPFFWAIIGKNLILTKGKIGTRTLVNYSDLNSDDGHHLNLNKILDFVYIKQYNIHILIREPNSRFKSGIFQEIRPFFETPNFKQGPTIPEFNDVKNIKNWKECDWISNLELFINQYIDNLENIELNELPVSFHIQNWLNIVRNFKSLFPTNKLKIWDFSEFHRLLNYLNCDTSNQKPINTSENRKYINEYLNAYYKLGENTTNRIHQYISEDVAIWNELVNEEKQYISIFDREIKVPPPKFQPYEIKIPNEIPNEETDKA